MTVVTTVMPVMPVRIGMSVPRRVLVCGVAVVIRLTIPVDVAVISPAAGAGHFDNVQHCRGAGLRDGGTSVRRHRGGAQSQRTKQRQNCGTHRRRPSKLHRNNDARSMEVVPGGTLTV